MRVRVRARARARARVRVRVRVRVLPGHTHVYNIICNIHTYWIYFIIYFAFIVPV